MDNELLTIMEVCKYLRVSKTTFLRIREKDIFPKPYIVNKRQLWKLSEIDEYLEKTRAG